MQPPQRTLPGLQPADFIHVGGASEFDSYDIFDIQTLPGECMSAFKVEPPNFVRGYCLFCMQNNNAHNNVTNVFRLCGNSKTNLSNPANILLTIMRKSKNISKNSTTGFCTCG